ncbi:hypothetical protein HOG48_06205 [Candidatus Peregrinibacteria bacterium]|jgi:protein O-mannosyl-transferase|nr:hypothetical protein [Candidatus Peregrinibacteria bacterium]
MQKIKNLLRKDWTIILLLFFAGLLLYVNTFKGPFLWDDIALVVENEHVHSFKFFKTWFTESALNGAGITHSSLYRPLATIVNASIYGVFGESAIAYRIVMFLMHFGSSVLVFNLFKKLSFSRVAGIFAAFLFLAHPVQTESVSYIAGMADVLSGLMILLGLNLFLSEKFKSPGIQIISVAGIFILALLSKEIGIILLPLVALLMIYKWKIFTPSQKKSSIQTIVTLAIIGGTYIILKLTALNFTGDLKLTELTNEYTESIFIRLITFITAIWEYFKLTFFPKDLFFEKPFNFHSNLIGASQIFGYLTVLTGLLFSYKFFRKGSRKFFLGFFWFFAALVPVSGIIVSNATYAEHWLYLPIIGIIILLAAGYDSLKGHYKKIFAGILILAIITLSVRTIYRNSEWADPESFYKNELKHNPGSPRLYNQMGRLEFKRGNANRAIKYFSEGLVKDQDRMLYVIPYNLGNAQFRIGDYTAAINSYFLSLEINPNNRKAHNMLYETFNELSMSDETNKTLQFLERIDNGEVLSNTEIREFYFSLPSSIKQF